MKNNILIIGILLILNFFQTYAQIEKKASKDSIDITRFCGFTETYDCVFGIHIDKENAINIALDIMDTEKKSNNMLSEMIIAVETMERKKGISMYQQFEKIASKGYRKITREEFIKLSKEEKKALLGNTLQFLNY